MRTLKKVRSSKPESHWLVKARMHIEAHEAHQGCEMLTSWTRRAAQVFRFFSSSLLLFWLTGCVGMGGVVIPLTHDPLPGSEQRFTETLVMEKYAHDLRAKGSRIGHATMTLFAIESGDVTLTRPLPEQVVQQVKLALESVGYKVKLVDRGDPAAMTSPVLKVKIIEFYFKNYNWLWPYVPTWGDIQLRLTVENREGTVVYEKSFKESGNSYSLTGSAAFGTATKEAMTKVVNEIVQACSSEEFRTAVGL